MRSYEVIYLSSPPVYSFALPLESDFNDKNGLVSGGGGSPGKSQGSLRMGKQLFTTTA